MSEQYLDCLDKLSEVNFSPAETLNSITFYANRNTLAYDSKAKLWNNLSGVKFIVIVNPLPLVDARSKY